MRMVNLNRTEEFCTCIQIRSSSKLDGLLNNSISNVINIVQNNYPKATELQRKYSAVLLR